MKENRLVVADTGWAETAPDWLLKEVEFERFTFGLASVLKPIEKVGDAEACLYLYTLCLAAPVSHELAEIYIYLSSKLMKRRGSQLQDFMEEKLKNGLTPDEERELETLKRELYIRRGREIKHPVIDAMKELKRRCNMQSKKEQSISNERENSKNVSLINFI